MPNHKGQQLGNYLLLDLLGSGGFGEVYLGTHILLENFAAIKILQAHRTDQGKKDFLVEAKRLMSLNHPHIVRMLDFGVQANSSYLIMEYAPHGSLKDRHDTRSSLPLPLPVDLVVTYVQQIASALQYLHDHKLIHRDIKPANILLGANETLLLSDVGLAVVAHSSASFSLQTESGTPLYMAPEQSQGRAVPASDQYALCVVAYEWLCGSPPFTSENKGLALHVDLREQHLHASPPSLSLKNPSVSPAMETVVLKALAKAPEDRYPSITAFATALQQANQQERFPSLAPKAPALSPGQLSLSQVDAPASNRPGGQMISNLVGNQFGNYRLLRYVSAGSFADVYVGEHIRLITLVAIKVLHTRLTHFETGDFLSEVRTVAILDHRNIVRVLDFDVKRDIPFLVLEYAPQGSLRQCHPRGSRLPPDTIISYVQQIAGALQYAHDKKLIHRAIKPENILMKSNLELLLSDFGLAIIDRSTHSHRIDQLAGMLTYMAPEQIKGKAQAASDQYALGVMVYEWMSGSLPFTGSPRELIAQHLYTLPPPLYEKIPGLSAVVEQVVMKALAKEPFGRYPCVQGFADALEQAMCLKGSTVQSSNEAPPQADALQEEDPILPSAHPLIISTPAMGPTASHLSKPEVPPSPQPQTQPHTASRHSMSRRGFIARGLLIGGGAVTVATLVDLVAHAGPRSGQGIPTPSPTRTAPHTPPPGFGTVIYSYSPNVSSAHAVFAVSLSPNGKRIASGWQDNMARVWDATTQQHFLQYARHAGYVKSVAWSPDSTQIASGGFDTTVRIWNATSGTDVLPAPYTGHTAPVRSVAWSENGALIASTGQDKTVQVWDAATGSLAFKFTGHTDVVFSVAWSPGSTRIVSGSGDQTVRVWDVTTGQHVLIYRGHSKRVNSVSFSPNGQYIASASYDNTVQVWDAATGGTSFKYIYHGHGGPVEVLAWSPDGTRIASGGDDKTVQVWDATTGANVHTFKSHSDSVWGLSWSPDEQYISSGSFDKTVKVWFAT